jgi:BirA family biotin operon repressor/biotin-[acetyl-CoA-carboxylase] ligase
MNLNSEYLKRKLAGQFIGHALHCYPQIGSTNDEAFRLGLQGAPEGTVLVADAQSAGKGRLARLWHSPPGANIYTSVLLRPRFAAARAPQISIAAGVTAAETLEPYCPGRAALKWPNDVQIGGKKICGILAQMKLAGADIDFVVVGIGVNVNWRPEQFPEEIRSIATSLFLETGRDISREDLLNRLYENLTKWYKSLLTCGFEAVRQAWLSRAPMIGQNVAVRFGDETLSGRAAGLDDDGSLILETPEGAARKVSAGDATILKR